MQSKQEFMKLALAPAKGIIGPPVPIYPFADWDYYYLGKPLTWRPNTPTGSRNDVVEVPEGFVTDLASVPQPFWSVLPPQGRYAYPAVVHDYLYWFQPCERHEADDVLRLAMEDVGVKSAQAAVIYQAVHRAGFKAWSSNRAAREAGERRVLSKFPADVTTRWADWKRDTGHFL